MSEFVTRVPLDAESPKRALRRPEEGWTALALSVLIVLVMAWTVDDPAWVNGKEAATDDLVTMALMGFFFGVLGPKVGWGRWMTHGIGAVFAGLVIPILAGWAMAPGVSPAVAFHIAAEGTAQAYLDIAWRGLQYTSQEVHYVVVIGAIVWATAQFFGYAVFGHHKPLNGIVMVGLVMAGNMAVTTRNQVPFLIVFTVASLFLLITMHAVDERSTWTRRRIGDPSAIASMYLKGGTVFIALAVVGSLLLTTRAASAPLAGAWGGVDDQLIAFGERIARLFPVGPDTRGGGAVTFGSSAIIRQTWFRGNGTAFTAEISPGMPEVKWRAASYDKFALGAWVQTDVSSRPVEPGAALLAGTPEEPPGDLTDPASARIATDQYKDTLALAPGVPIVVDQPADVQLQGDYGSFVGVDLGGNHEQYLVYGAVLQVADEDLLKGGIVSGITGNQLEAASTEYPEAISARYTEVPEDALGPDAEELLATILASAPGRNPYVLATYMQAYLQDDSNFQYSDNVAGLCDVTSAVECFARMRRGYCLHYASTMAILLRAANPDNPIPTRLVQGFLPGTRNGLVETVEAQNAHAWVEVYFPGYGWIPFDPTGGGRGRPSVIPAGPEVAGGDPTPAASRLPEQPDPTRRIAGTTPAGDPAAPTSAPVDRVLLIVLAVLLAVVVVGLAIASWVRGPRSEVSPDAAWATMLRAASRFGFGPRPTQTVYEYAGSLAELVPVARDDLQTVAEAKVETQYAKVRLGGARLEAVRDATRRLRISLLRLALRRPRRRRRR